MGFLSEIISGIIQGLYSVIDSISTSGRVKETVKEHIVKNEFIHNRIKNLLHIITADRIDIAQYHNGGYFYSGLPLQKYSCTYEVVSGGISSEMTHHQNKLVSESPLLHSAIIKNNKYSITDTSKLDDETFKQKLSQRGVKSFYAFGIWDIQDNLIGLICVDYVINKHELSTTEEELLSNLAKLVAGYIIPSQNNQNKNNLFTLFIFILAFLIILSQVAFLSSSIYNLIKLFLH